MSKKLRGPAVNVSFDSRAIPVMIDGIANTILEVMKKFTEFKDQRSLWLASLTPEQRAVVMGMHHHEEQHPKEDITSSKEQHVIKQFKDSVRDLENKYGKYVEDLPRASAEEDFDEESYWDDGCPTYDDEDGDGGIHEDLNDHYRKRVHELYGDHCDDSCDKVTAMARDIIGSIKNTGVDPMVLLNKVRELWNQH